MNTLAFGPWAKKTPRVRRAMGVAAPSGAARPPAPPSAGPRAGLAPRRTPSGGALRRPAPRNASRTQDGSPRSGQEPHLQQERHRLRLGDRLAVEALDRKPSDAALPDVPDERFQGRAQPPLLRLAQRDERTAAALDEERGLSAEQNDVSAGDARRASPGPPRPGKRGAVGLGRIGGGEDERVVVLVAVAAPAAARPLRRARTGRRPALRRSSRAGRGRASRARAAPRTPPRSRPGFPPRARRRASRFPAARAGARRARAGPAHRGRDVGQRPASLRRRDRARPLARETTRPPLAAAACRTAGRRAAESTRRSLPRRTRRAPTVPAGQTLLETGRLEQVEPELGAGRERLAQPVVHVTFRALGRGYPPERRCVVAEVDRDAVEARADPDDLARGAPLVELRRLVAGTRRGRSSDSQSDT